MNALFGFLSSPLKKQPEIPTTATMPVSASQQSRTSSPRNHRIPKRASNQFSESEGRSPLSRRSNVSSITSVHDTTGDISITSTRRETIATMPPPTKTPKRKSMGGVQSSSVPRRTTASQRVSSSPRPRPTKRQPSVELGEDSMMSAFSRSPAVSSKTRSTKNSPATSVRSTRTSAANSPATSTTKKGVTMKPNFMAVSSPLAASDVASSRPSPRAQPRSRRSQVVVEVEESEEEEYEEEHQAPEVQEEHEENLEEEEPEKEIQEDIEEDIVPEEEEEEEKEKEEDGDDDEEHAFEQIMDYRWVGDKIELRVKWADGERTWSPEEVFHEDSPDALFDFWRKRPGGRPDNPENPGTYLVFAIRKHRTYRHKNQVFVEWLGYPESEGTWENQDYIEQVATDHFDDYMDKLKEAGKVKLPAKGRTAEPLKKKGTAKPVGKGRGRPKGSTKSTLNKTQGKSRVTKR
ncbi:hypothetical protein EDB82DRAFT_502167 [Fusarium venenatum]|uniref:uncharacterized protein n=1 Tax=Fusarium venenatum TaxID=56646 RepID=UPI001DF8EA77|nr:hypothetical protein EDB82DRAFT_502167 [Fusarium venenatum]